MTDDMAEKIAQMLVQMGYNNVRVDAGIVYYAELDGTEHRLVEDVKVDTPEGMRWASTIEK